MTNTHIPLGLYNKLLVWVSLYPSLSLSILVGLSFSPPTPFSTFSHYHFTFPRIYFSYLVNPYSSNGKRQNLQCHESTTSRLVDAHEYLAFRDLDENALSQIIGETHRRKTPIKEDEA
jgi:hypothetical protein